MKWCVFALTLLIPPAAPAADRDALVRQQIMGQEQRLNDALSRVDAGVVAQIWSDDFVFVFPNGRISNKSERLAGLKPAAAAPTMTSTIDDISVRSFGNVAVAIVKTAWRGEADGKPFTEYYVATHVWVQQGKFWRLASAQVAQAVAKPP
jgi:ketosteroid isomerase-like protein